MNFDYKGVKVSYEVFGEGSAIVLLHGFLENKKMWKDSVPMLSQKNKVIVMDLLGHGKTGNKGYIHSMEEMATMVYAVITSLQLRKVKIVGHSLGGYVALAFAEKYPTFIKALCLMNSTAQADSEERIELRTRANQMAQKNYDNMVRMSIANLFSPENTLRLHKTIEVVKKEALETSLQGYMAVQEGMKARPNREHIVQDHPTDYIIGAQDPILNSSKIIEEAQRNHAPYNVLEGGHMSHLECKEEFLKLLAKFASKK